MKKTTNDKKVKITSGLHSEFSSEVTIAGIKYQAVTEYERPNTITRFYLKGEVVASEKVEISRTLKASKSEKKIHDFIRTQHRRAVSAFTEQKQKELKGPSEYLTDVKSLLARKHHRNALKLLEEALVHHPGDPFLMSYRGCMIAVVSERYDEGIRQCGEAMRALKSRLPFGHDFFYPVFYLNLSRAYLAAGRKNEAVDALNKGLAMDSENKDLLWELTKLGLRRKPAVSFLPRSSPINKYIGLLLHRVKQ